MRSKLGRRTAAIRIGAHDKSEGQRQEGGPIASLAEGVGKADSGHSSPENFGHRVAAYLDAGLLELPQGIVERLQNSRQIAVRRKA